jgi:hypothetical protein
MLKRKEEKLKMDAEKHIREKERLNQALSGKLPEVQNELEQVFHKYGVDSMPGLAHDVSCYAIEEIYIKRFSLPEY